MSGKTIFSVLRDNPDYTQNSGVRGQKKKEDNLIFSPPTPGFSDFLVANMPHTNHETNG